jgi:hypothetical protein
MAILFDDIENAFLFVSMDQKFIHNAYLCKKTGQIFYTSELGDSDKLPDDIDDTEKYITIPHKNDLNLGKALVFDFSHKGMIIAYLLLFYTVLIFLYLRFKKLHPLTLTGSLIYFLFNTAVFVFFLFSQFLVLKTADVIMFVFAFVPGIYSALVCTVYLIKDGKLKKSLA